MPNDNLGLINFITNFIEGKEIIFMGDFNLPSLNWSLNSVQESISLQLIANSLIVSQNVALHNGLSLVLSFLRVTS